MAKLALTDIAAGYAVVATINANNALIETALENTLSRDGTSPNTMSADLDLNSNKITNLTDGTNAQDAVTKAQLDAAVLGTGITVTAGDVNAESATDGYVLTADGAGVAAWEAVPAGGSVAAADVSVVDSGGNLAATDVEDAIAEMYTDFPLSTTLASTGVGDGAALIGISDAGLLITATDVEGALVELAAAMLENIVEDTTPQLGGALDANGNAINMGDQQITRPVLTDYGITSNSLTVAANAVSIDLTTGNAFEVDLEAATAGVTITLSNPPASGTYGEAIVKVQQDSTADRAITWAGGTFVWPGGAAPTMTTGSDSIDIYSFKTWNGGTTWYANASQDYS